jgi:hypothetical protein
MSSSSSKSAKLAYHFGTVTTDSVTTDNLYLDKGSVTQASSITTSVTLPKPVGLVRTVNSTLVTGGSVNFTGSHLSINTDSIIFASIGAYSGDAGHPSVRISSQTQGSCVFTLQNSHKDSALNGVVTIAYQIL